MRNVGPLVYSGVLRILLKPKTVHRQLHEPRVNKEQFFWVKEGGGGEVSRLLGKTPGPHRVAVSYIQGLWRQRSSHSHSIQFYICLSVRSEKTIIKHAWGKLF